MKKSFVLLLTLVLLISGTACYAQNALLQEKDQVHFEEMYSYGDKSVVEGVTVEMYSQYMRNLFWKTTYTLGETPKEETAHEVYPLDKDNSNNTISGEITFVLGNSDAHVMGYMEEKDYSGLQAAMKELYDQTEPGEVNQMTVKLKDYGEYYQFGMELVLPKEETLYTKYYGYSYYFIADLEKDIAQAEAKKVLKDLKNFNEFFKIPVLENEIYTIALKKDAEGKVIGTAMSSFNGGSSSGDMDFIQIPDIDKSDNRDGYSMELYYEFSDGDCFMTFSPKTYKGNTVDTSLIPGGFGIYRFAYDSTKGTIDSEHIEMVYALDPEMEIAEFRLDASKKNLLVRTIENGREYLSVIDRNTMTLKDKFDIGSEEVYIKIYSMEEYMVIAGETIAVYPMNTDGQYVKAFEVDAEAINGRIDETIGDVGMMSSIPNWYGSFDWDGETLLFGCYNWYNNYNLARGMCEFSIAAIDKTGLIYYGGYRSTLCSYFAADEVAHTENSCTPDDSMEAPVIVHWAKK